LRASSQSLAIASLVALPLSLCHAAPLRINGAQVGFRVSGFQVGSVSVWESGSESGQWLAGAAAVNLLHSPKLQLQQSVVLLLPPTIYHSGRGCGGQMTLLGTHSHYKLISHVSKSQQLKHPSKISQDIEQNGGRQPRAHRTSGIMSVI